MKLIPGDIVVLDMRKKRADTVRKLTRATTGPVVGIVSPWPATQRTVMIQVAGGVFKMKKAPR